MNAVVRGNVLARAILSGLLDTKRKRDGEDEEMRARVDEEVEHLMDNGVRINPLLRATLGRRPAERGRTRQGGPPPRRHGLAAPLAPRAAPRSLAGRLGRSGPVEGCLCRERWPTSGRLLPL